jgi:hypothetical protein
MRRTLWPPPVPPAGGVRAPLPNHADPGSLAFTDDIEDIDVDMAARWLSSGEQTRRLCCLVGE